MSAHAPRRPDPGDTVHREACGCTWDFTTGLPIDYCPKDAPEPHDSRTCDFVADCDDCEKERLDNISAAADCWNPYA